MTPDGANRRLCSLYASGLLHQVALGIESRTTTHSGCRYGLLVVGVGHIAGGKYAGSAGSSGRSGHFYETGFVKIHRPKENLRIGLMADGKEKAVDGNIVKILVGSAAVCRHMRAFKHLFAERPMVTVLNRISMFSFSRTRCCITLEARR